MDCELHIVLDFKRGQHQIIAVLRQMIGGAPDPLLHIDDTICNIADIHGFVYPAVEIIPLKVHRSALVGQNHVHHKIPKLLAVVIGHAFLKITGIEGINVRPYIVHRAVHFPQGLLHNIQHNRKNHINLLVRLHKSVLLPRLFCHTVLQKKRIHADMLHSPGELL